MDARIQTLAGLAKFRYVADGSNYIYTFGHVIEVRCNRVHTFVKLLQTRFVRTGNGQREDRVLGEISNFTGKIENSQVHATRRVDATFDRLEPNLAMNTVTDKISSRRTSQY